jgi:hypothetical protein
MIREIYPLQGEETLVSIWLGKAPDVVEGVIGRCKMVALVAHFVNSLFFFSSVYISNRVHQ